MSDEWAITPPSSPVFRRKKNDGSSPRKLLAVLDDWNTRMFYCMGEPQHLILTFHEESYLRKNDIDIFKEDRYHSSVFADDFGSQILFNRKFDKGSALVLDMHSLFNMAKFSYIQLDSAAKLNVKTFGTNVVPKKMIDYSKCREDIVNLFLYVRNYIQRISACPKYKWMADSLLPKVEEELNSFRLLCGTIDRLPDCLINYSTNNAGNKCSHPSYHLFHCHLDIKWLHITLMYQLVTYKRRFKNDDDQENVRFGNVELFENYVRHMISDLIIIGLKRFEHIAYQDLPSKFPFVCTCVRELWKLMQLCIDLLHNKGQSMAFWDYVNEACDKIFVTETLNQDVTNCSELSLCQSYTCSNPSLFIIWLLKHLAMLYKGEKFEDTKSNYKLLENTIRTCVSIEIAESQMRVFLHLVEFWLNIDWEVRTEPLVLLWEYFHKKLNSLFFVPGAPIDGLAIVSKNAVGLINQLNSVLDTNVTEKNMDSFHLFLRLLGRSLRKWHDNSRFWNQLKGRIFSKFSLAKLLSLNETGLYHFIALFLTLALTSDLLETSMKMQSLLTMLPIDQLDDARSKLIWKAHITLILLFAERGQDISGVCNPLLDAVDAAVVRPDNLELMRIFSDGFQDLMDSTNNLELGQYIFIGKWIPIYLSKCSESDASRFLDSLLTLMNHLNSILSLQLPLGRNSQLLLIYNNLSEHLVPYLKKESVNPRSLHHISDLAATLTGLSVKACFCNIVNSEAKDLFKFLLTQDTTDIGLLCRYLGQISRYTHLHTMLNCNSILLIKGWLRCLIVLSNNDTQNEDLSAFTNYVVTLPELKELFSETGVIITSNSNYFENFLIALQFKYQSGNRANDQHLRNKLISQVGSYFLIDRWLSYIMKDIKVIAMASNIYYNLGQVFFKIPQLLYVRSKPNTLLQKFLDTLLLPNAVRQSHFKLSTRLCEAIKSSFYLYICGLFKLDPENDPFILRNIKDLIAVYVPRLVTPKGSICAPSVTPFSLMKCFEFSENFEFISKTIITTICSSFIKPRMKMQPPSAFQALIFFNNLVRYHKHKDQVVKCFIENALERVCDVIMFSEEGLIRKEAREILHFILEMHLIRDNAHLGHELMNVFSKVSRENLAFNSRTLFDLFEEVIPLAPDLVLRFLPQLEEKIKEVETKRGVGHDRSLRKGLERIEQALKKVKNNQKSNLFS